MHAQHAHVMISVWGKFYTGTANFDAMQKAGFLYQPNLKEGIHGLDRLSLHLLRRVQSRRPQAVLVANQHRAVQQGH